MNGNITNRHGGLHWKVRGRVGVLKREREKKALDEEKRKGL